MLNTLLGIKKGMTATYDSRGRRVGATMVEIAPNFVTQIKSEEGKDGYNGVQLGYGTKKSVKKPQLGLGKKIGIEKGIRWFREIKMEDPSTTLGTIQPGTEIKLDQAFSIGDAVRVSGISKGRGFAGVVKRHGFHGGPKTHGQSDRHRAPGSIGSGTTPGRVYKGKKMAGHMGAEKVSVRGLEVVGLDKEKNLLTIKGGIPGPTGGLVILTNLGKIKGYTPPPEEKAEEEVEESKELEGESANTSEVKLEGDSNADTSEVSKEEGAFSSAKATEDKLASDGGKENGS